MTHSLEELDEFKVEAHEFLDLSEKSLLSLDPHQDFKPAYDSVFRGFHNLKGAAGMMELHELQALMHELENKLMEFKDRSQLPKAYVNYFLQGIDAARLLLQGKPISFNAKEAPAVDSVDSPALSHSKPEKDPALLEFMTEAEEMIERISNGLQSVESGNSSKEILDALYRDIHSLKGAAYLFSFTTLGKVAHAMESSLESVREGTHLPSKALIDALFKSLKFLELVFKKSKNSEPETDYSETIEMITGALAASAAELKPHAGEPLGAPLAAPPDSALSLPEKKLPSAPETSNEPTSSIRVPVSVLDNLMTLMGEMVLVRNQVLQFADESGDLAFLSMSKRLNAVTSEIQDEMMKTRMQPIGNVLSKFKRVVRDLAQELGKNIELSLSGADTELDKSLLEAIKDPLTHIVRNSCDHGIELPSHREKNGKPATGTLSIRAFHEGGQVVVEVSDDGKGLHTETLKAKAIEKGMINAAQAASLTEKEAFHLIFAPGFSTAAQVTNVSGRGVGMDVVRTNIERIGGTVELSSQPHQGTTIKIKVPLTLAIVPALIVNCEKGTFAIPQVKLEELVRVDSESSEHAIEMLHGAPVLRLRGNILPLIDLATLLNLKKTSVSSYESTACNVAVLNAEQFSFGLLIDKIQDTADIVVKPLNRALKTLQAYAGATILGDGSIALILDVIGLSKISKIGSQGMRESQADRPELQTRHDRSSLQEYILVRVQSPTKHAFVLQYVHRLEEFSRDALEYSGNQRVIRYRDSILPIVSASQWLGYPAAPETSSKLSVIVIQRGAQLYGIEVEEILDTLSSACDCESALNADRAIFGNLNLPEELVVVIDPYELLNRAFPGKFCPELSAPSAAAPKTATPVPTPSLNQAASFAKTSPSRILLAEDAAFFRRAIKKILEDEGHEVLCAEDGQIALEILKQDPKRFHIIVSDIEMPRMNGFELAAAIKKDPALNRLPLLAVSSRSDPNYVARGKNAGFDIYLEKLNSNSLLESLEKLLNRASEAA